jgi:hypothetical protein
VCFVLYVFAFSKVYIVGSVWFCMETWEVVVVFAVGFCFWFGFLYFVGDSISGNVIWVPGSVGNCGDSEILALWDSVFVEDSGGVIILKEFVAPEGDCEKYIAYKNDSNGVLRVIYGVFWEDSWVSSDPLYDSGKKVLNSGDFSALYVNTSSAVVESFESQSDISSMFDFIVGISDGVVVDWSIVDENGLKDMYNVLYEFVDVSGVSFDEGVDSFNYYEEDVYDLNFSSVDISARKDESIFRVDYLGVDYDPDFVVDFVQNIGDYGFYMDSGWNFAFDLNSYFDISEGINVSFDFVGVNNTGGEWIDYLIDGSDVSFAPASGFEGGRLFRLVASNPAGSDVFSNYFAVNISEFNSAPILTDPFVYLYIPRGGNKVINLDFHFEDADGDDLSYRVVEVDNLTVSINGSMMTLSFVGDAEYDRFRVYASDGVAERKSGYIFVFIDGGGGAESVVGGDDLAGAVGNESGFGASGNVSGDGEGDFSWVTWSIAIVLGVVVLGVVVFVVYFFVLKKDFGDTKIGSVSLNSDSVNSYLKKLNLGKR